MAGKDRNTVEVREGKFVDKTEAVIPARAGEIALEINFIKRRAAEGLLKDAIEIGRLLCEAKETVPRGAWGQWLSDNVSYSASTANDMMRLYNEQQQLAQLDMFGEWGFEMFEGLAPSKVVELIRLPAADRREFVEKHDVDEMSVRAIKAEIKAEREAKELAEARVRELEQTAAGARDAAADAMALANERQGLLDKVTAQLEAVRTEFEIERAPEVTVSPEERERIEKEARKAAEDAAKTKIEKAKKDAEKQLEKARAEGAEALKKAQAEQDATIRAAVEKATA